MSRILPAILFALAPAVALAESAMPSIGYTGAPADHNGQNCSVCHSTFGAANSDTRGSVTVSITNYNPGVPQMIHVTVMHPTASRWGFQMTIREVSDESTEAGIFSTSAGVPFTVVCDDGTHFGSAPPCNANNGRQFAEQINAPRTGTGAGFDWLVPWTPPQTEVGRLHIYVAAVAADGDGTAQGDRVYTYEGTLPFVGACSLSVAPNLRTVMNGASFQPPFSSNAMITVFGTNFQVSGLQRTVGLGDLENNNTTFPTTLACVAIEVTGPGIAQPVRLPIAFVEDDQINAQAPEFVGTGPVMLKVVLNPDKPNQLLSDVATLNSEQAFAPAFFVIPNSTTIAAQIGGTSIPIADPSLVPGGQAAKPGQIVTLYGTGFGDFMQPVPTGQLTTEADPLATPITVTVGTSTLSSADVLYAGTSPGLLGGLYQFNVRIPASTPDGDTPITISIGGFKTQTGLTIPVHQ
ncbi:MAG TPA: choice-of-anchor V domain-containing protein [Bryobacteraceae bacterium]|jgi:uncharacterized protein (TIGR03437 family)|nr:choice-of-anchor V domain-containing protein [Bryobacteraceae bacterium]